MDFFADKIAQRWGTRDAIKANSRAEAEEAQKLQQQVEEYQTILSDMKVLSEQNVALAEKMTGLADHMDRKMEEMKAVDAGVDRTAFEERMQASDDAIGRYFAGAETSMAGYFKAAEENLHKENVRVYRNVQAAMIDELRNQTQELELSNKVLLKKFRGCKGLMIVTLVLASLALFVSVADAFGLIEMLMGLF